MGLRGWSVPALGASGCGDRGPPGPEVHAQRLVEVTQERHAELPRGWPGRENARGARVAFEEVRGPLVKADEVRVGEVVFEREGVRWVDKPGGDKIRQREDANALSELFRQPPYERDRAEIEYREDGKKVATENRATY